MAGKSAVIKKQLSYKRATYLQGAGNLQADLQKAVGVAKTVGTRKQIVDPEENTVLLLNSIRSNWTMLFGSMLLYTRGRNQPLVTENDGAAELTVEQLAPPPNQQGARRDFIESLLFFGIKNNHVVIQQSSGLRARQLESHLNWLIQTQTEVLSSDDRIALADHPSKNAIAKALLSPVKSVSVGIPLETESAMVKKPKNSKQTHSFQPSGAGFDVLSTLLGPKWMNKVKLSDSLDESRLKVEVVVSYTRETSTPGQKLLNDIALTMRHQEPEDVKIELKNGGKLAGEELKVTGSVSVNSFGGLVEPGDLFLQMREWLKIQIDAGLIDP